MVTIENLKNEIDQALALVQQGRRTLREAREKQHQVRLSRKYCRTTFKAVSWWKCRANEWQGACPSLSTDQSKGFLARKDAHYQMGLCCLRHGKSERSEFVLYRDG